jgi:septum formation protein
MATAKAAENATDPAEGAPLILASASPRRLELLRQIDIEPDRVIPADVDESVHKHELPHVYARRVAWAKLDAVAGANPSGFVLAADTVVALGRRILPKAETPDEAKRCLEALSGRRHRVLGAICLQGPDGRRVQRLVTTRVAFKQLSAQDIQGYLDSGEWRGKAGGYAIQGAAAAFIPWINGSYPNVVGLALTETLALLRGLGYQR